MGGRVFWEVIREITEPIELYHKIVMILIINEKSLILWLILTSIDAALQIP